MNWNWDLEVLNGEIEIGARYPAPQSPVISLKDTKKGKWSRHGQNHSIVIVTIWPFYNIAIVDFRNSWRQNQLPASPRQWLCFRHGLKAHWGADRLLDVWLSRLVGFGGCLLHFTQTISEKCCVSKVATEPAQTPESLPLVDASWRENSAWLASFWCLYYNCTWLAPFAMVYTAFDMLWRLKSRCSCAWNEISPQPTKCFWKRCLLIWLCQLWVAGRLDCWPL